MVCSVVVGWLLRVRKKRGRGGERSGRGRGGAAKMAENHVAGTNNLEGLEALNNETVDLVREEEKEMREMDR